MYSSSESQLSLLNLPHFTKVNSGQRFKKKHELVDDLWVPFMREKRWES